MKKDKQPIQHWNIREEREKQNKIKKSCIDEVTENAKKHFEEIFNRR